MLGKAFFVEKVADCAASEQFLWRGLAVQSPVGALGGFCGPYGASRARLRPLARLAPPCGRCWAIRGTAPVKLANQPKRPRSEICAGLFGLRRPLPGKDR